MHPFPSLLHRKHYTAKAAISSGLPPSRILCPSSTWQTLRLRLSTACLSFVRPPLREADAYTIPLRCIDTVSSVLKTCTDRIRTTAEVCILFFSRHSRVLFPAKPTAVRSLVLDFSAFTGQGKLPFCNAKCLFCRQFCRQGVIHAQYAVFRTGQIVIR